LCAGSTEGATLPFDCRKLDQLVHAADAWASGVKVIRRFSGGGTVVVDEDTMFVTLIMQSTSLTQLECYPRPIMRWSEGFYSPVFSCYGEFRLRENGNQRPEPGSSSTD
jgi:lipoate-protein ligase A